MLLYTSGTTGNPKGVLHIHRMLLHIVDWTCVHEDAAIREDTRSGIISSFSFVGTQMFLLGPLSRGGTVCIAPEVARKDIASLYRFRVLAPLGFPDPLFRSGDYFPMLPWYFLFLCGWFLGKLFQKSPRCREIARVKIPILSAIGRKTIWIYMLHQPILMGLCMLIFGR